MTKPELLAKMAEWVATLQRAFDSMSTAAYDECSDNDLVILQGDIEESSLLIASGGLTGG